MLPYRVHDIARDEEACCEIEIPIGMLYGVDLGQQRIEVDGLLPGEVPPSSVSGSWRENPRKGVQVRRACADT